MDKATIRRMILAAVMSSVAGTCVAASGEVVDKSDEVIGKEIAQKAMTAVERQLKDPKSAQFTGFHAWDKDPGSICGTVNAKNGFGGYVGEKPFRYIVEQDEAYLNQGNGCP